jgi:hypothetical protein
MIRRRTAAAVAALTLAVLGPALPASAGTAPSASSCSTWSLTQGGPYTGEPASHPVLVVRASVAFCAGEVPPGGTVWMTRYGTDVGRRTTWPVPAAPGTTVREWYVQLSGMPAVVCVSDAYTGPVDDKDPEALVNVTNHACLALPLGQARPVFVAIPPDDPRVTRPVKYYPFSGTPACGSCV